MKDDGVPKFAEQDPTNNRFAAMEARVADLERRLAAWDNLQVDPASGGGGVTVGGNSVIIRINSLTNQSAQMP